MPIYDTQEENGRLSIRLKSLQLVEQDIQNYGPIERSDQELEERVRHHVTQMQAYLPSPQTVLADDSDAFLHLLLEYYPIMYRGLLVGYTGMWEPFRLTVTPRYTTSVAFDDSEQEHSFVGRSGLLTLLKDEQADRRTSAKGDECDASEYLLTLVQVSIYDAEEVDQSAHFVCYTVEGDVIVSVHEQAGVSEDVLCGLGLSFVGTFVSAQL